MEADLILPDVAGRSNEADMINLPPETVALAERLGAAQGVSVAEAIRQAIEKCARDAGVTAEPERTRDMSPEAIAARLARIQQVVDDIAAMPVLDPRSPREIMDELNEL